MNRAELAKKMDHTLLKPDASAQEVVKLCEEAVAYGCASACVNGSRVAQAVAVVAGSDVLVAGVVGFPLGAGASRAKAEEARIAAQEGARELDMVLNIGALKDGADGLVRDDIAAVVQAAPDAVVKVILETGLLTDAEKTRAARLAVEAGAHFVKTSTGFGHGGATVEDVRLMREAVGDGARIKASGGIRDLDTALRMIEAGADRLGLSATARVLEALP